MSEPRNPSPSADWLSRALTVLENAAPDAGRPVCENCCKAPAIRILEDHSLKVMRGQAKLCGPCCTRAAETIMRDGGIPAIGNL